MLCLQQNHTQNITGAHARGGQLVWGMWADWYFLAKHFHSFMFKLWMQHIKVNNSEFQKSKDATGVLTLSMKQRAV